MISARPPLSLTNYCWLTLTLTRTRTLTLTLTLTLTTCASKRACVTQLGWAHATEGTHRLALPVSKITLNGCGGVPIPIVPTYWLFLKLRSSCAHHSARAQLATVFVPVVPFG